MEHCHMFYLSYFKTYLFNTFFKRSLETQQNTTILGMFFVVIHMSLEAFIQDAVIGACSLTVMEVCHIPEVKNRENAVS